MSKCSDAANIAHMATAEMVMNMTKNKKVKDFLIGKADEITSRRASNKVLSKVDDEPAKTMIKENEYRIQRAELELDNAVMATLTQNPMHLSKMYGSMRNQGLGFLADVSDFITNKVSLTDVANPDNIVVRQLLAQ